MVTNFSLESLILIYHWKSLLSVVRSGVLVVSPFLNHICAIYDGMVWKTYNSVDGHNFLTSPHCYLLALNVDWFERGVYSVGAIYLTIQNLPRDERYKTKQCYPCWHNAWS